MSEAIPAMDMTDNPTGCCPRFHAEPWDGKEFNFEGLKFVTVKTRSFFYVPLNMAPVMRRTQAAAEAAGAVPKDRYLMLSRESSPWGASHRLLVAGDVPGMETAGLPGTWFAKVFEGPFSQVGSWYRQMAEAMDRKYPAKADAAGQGPKRSREILSFYTTCPSCAKAYGKNYVVLFGKAD